MCCEERPCCCAVLRETCELHVQLLQRDKAHRPVHRILGEEHGLMQRMAAMQCALGCDSQGCDFPSHPVEDELQGLPCSALQAATLSPSPRL